MSKNKKPIIIGISYPLPITIILVIFFSFICNASENKEIDFPSKIYFWKTVKKGTNIFNKEISREDIKAAKKYGIDFIRLAPDKFISNNRDFLIGNADNYQKIPKEDLKHLKDILDMCHEEGMPVVLTMLSLPGSRWNQNNNDKDDLRIWNDPNFQKQVLKFWKDLASELIDHPAIVGYNILNEPHIERIYDNSSVDIYDINQNKTQDILYKFYKNIISGIREIDQNTPIILDSSSYADPRTFDKLIPQKHENIIYSFHMYEPYTYTNEKMNSGKFKYPGKIKEIFYNKDTLKKIMLPVIEFQKKHNIPSSQILVGEFGGNRKSKGLHIYFKDLIEIFKENNWHFAFYAFREDVWDGMDYELGNKKLPWSYWKSLEKGEKPKISRNPENKIFKTLLNSLNKPNTI